MEQLTRRQALTIAAAATAACACCAEAQDGPPKPGPGGGPGGGGGQDKTPPPKEVNIGKLSDYPKDGLYDAHAKSKVLVGRLEGKLYAMDARCTHKQCVVKKVDDESLKCPCHKSLFSKYGTPTEGQAKIALYRFALKQNADGTITVDTTHSFKEKEWEKPEASIAIPA